MFFSRFMENYFYIISGLELLVFSVLLIGRIAPEYQMGRPDELQHIK